MSLRQPLGAGEDHLASNSSDWFSGPTQPTTSVQIKLADGTGGVKVQPTYTVNDIRQFLILVLDMFHLQLFLGEDWSLYTM